MNKAIFIGRIASDVEFRTTQNGKSQANFRLAVQRRFKDANGERQADFFYCVAWQHNAEFIHKFIHKGDKVGVVGSLQNRSYQAQDGTTRYITELLIDELDGFGGTQGRSNEAAAGGFTEVSDDELPF